MNKLKKILLRSFTTSLLLCSLIFCSACSGFLTDNIWVSDSSTVLGSGFVRLRATILNYNKVTSDELISESSPSARSINPVMASQNYAFYLYGQKSSDMQNIGIGPSKINQISDTTGEFSMDIPRGIWVLTLVAVKDEPGLDLSNLTKIKQNALLWGSTVCDYTNDSSPVNFILAPDGLSTKGTATVDIALSGWTVSDHIGVTGDNLENIKVKAGIYRYNKTGAERIVAEEIFTFTNDGSTDKYSFAPKDTADSSKNLEINPGSYEFIVSFYEEVSYTDPGTSETINYTIREWVWSDQINIFPGRETSTTVKIPKLVSEPPAAPSNFTVTPLETNDENFASADGLYYTCKFTWQDNSDTETGFEIKLTDLDDSTFTKIYDSNISDNKFLCISGNLKDMDGKYDEANTEEEKQKNIGLLVARIPLGRRIKAEICAVNNSNRSEWISYSNSSPLNIYSVTFHFNGGSNNEEVSLGNGLAQINTGDLKDSYTFYGPDSDKNLISFATENDRKKIYILENDRILYFKCWGKYPLLSESQLADTNNIYSSPYNPFSNSNGNYQNIDLWAQYEFIAPNESNGTIEEQEQALEKRITQRMKINNNKIKDEDFDSTNTSLSYNNNATLKFVLDNKVIGGNSFKYEFMRISLKDISNNRTLLTASEISDDTHIFIDWASSITIQLTLDSENFKSGKTYKIFIEARPENTNDLITTTLYFNVN